MVFKTKIGKQSLEVQTQDLAPQASGSCWIKLGETSVLCTCQRGEEKSELDFFPLTCDYEERYYAAGKILGPRFIRREGRPSTEAILISRAIDRSLRPLFPAQFKQEIQVIATCLSWDGVNDPAILAILGSSIALLISEIPWQGPIGVVRIGKVNQSFILNPNYQEREEGELDLVIAGVKEKEKILINMIELQGEEVSLETLLGGIEFARPYLEEIINFQKEIQEKEGKEKIVFPSLVKDLQLEKKVRNFLKKRLKEALYQKEKQKRHQALEELREELLAEIKKEKGGEKAKLAETLFQKEQNRVLRETILKEGERPDGRGLRELREIKTEAGILPRTHGSAIFSRGETKVLSILTLGAPGDQQLLEGMEISGKKRFLHHYNFLPYSVGEVKPLRGPGRREIGHGILVEKALLPLIPKFEDFPYTIRVVSEMLSSNGSTSMASVSAASLALMDGGVPIKRPAAGVAIGLITDPKDPQNYQLLTDIQGPEDSLGDMDLKVAGTEKGITALQMDVKLKGITGEILKQGLILAEKARKEILEIQNKTLSRPRTSLSSFAPRVYTININPEKIGQVIGSGGRMINEIIEECEVSIDIEESGKIFITAEKEQAAKKAINWIRNLTREVKIGQIFQGKIKRILSFGVIVEIFPGQEGLVHISELANFRIRKIEDLVKIGDIIPVKVIGTDPSGRINLSAKQAGFSSRTKFFSKKKSSFFTNKNSSQTKNSPH